MRLTTTSGKKKSSLKPTKQRQKKEKGPKLSKFFSNTDKYRAIRAQVPLTRLTYGMIKHHNLEYIETEDGEVYFSDSWVELVLFMIHAVITAHPNTFMELLTRNEVTNQSIVLDKTYGKYSFDSNKQYKVYDLYNSGYFVEAIFESSNIFSSIVGLVNILGIAYDKIRFGIVSKEFIEKELNFDILEDDEIIVDIYELAAVPKRGKQLVEFIISEERVKMQGFAGVLWVFCKIMLETYGVETLSTLPKYKSTGISSKNDRDDVEYMQLKGTELFMYSDGTDSGIIKFIVKSAEQLGIEGDLIKFKFRTIKKV